MRTYFYGLIHVLDNNKLDGSIPSSKTNIATADLIISTDGTIHKDRFGIWGLGLTTKSATANDSSTTKASTGMSASDFSAILQLAELAASGRIEYRLAIDAIKSIINSFGTITRDNPRVKSDFLGNAGTASKNSNDL